MKTSFLEAALQYHDRGWCVIPICHRDESGKQPTVPWKTYQEHRAKDQELRKWFDARNLDGLAVILGRVSGGLYCRDFDVAADYQAWAAAQSDWAGRLPTVRTARGFHVYALGEAVPSRKVERGELRSEGQYCLLPPSVHPSGVRYEWQVPLPSGELPCVEPGSCGLLGSMESYYREPECRPLLLCDSVSLCLSLSVSDPCIQRALEQSLPSKAGQRNERLFHFARLLKAIPQLADRAPRDLKPFVRAWFDRALPFIRTKSFETCMGEFGRGWEKIRIAIDSDPLAEARRRALAEPLPACAQRFEGQQTRLLVAICAQLQRMAGAKPFFLSYRSAGKLIGTSHVDAGSLLGFLRDEGVIKLAKGGTTTRAARYRYIGDGGCDERETDAEERT